MKDVFEILDKMQFFQGQRAGRELWGEKPKEVQDEDIKSFNDDIDCLREHIKSHSIPVWTPCDKGLPKSDGFYMATIRLDNILQHREYEKRIEFDRGHWCGMSSDMKVVAWREESPYKPDHIVDPNKKVEED